MGTPAIRYGVGTAPQTTWDAPVPVRGSVATLASMIGAGRVVVLSGAGLSTDSGIPDYRGPTSARRRHAPMTYDAFVADPAARHRYWARGYVGWPRISGARPNAGHGAVATLQRAGLLHGIITQNVDGLHQAAGARDVVELHGALVRVVCLACAAVIPREVIQARLRGLNPGFDVRVRDAAQRSSTIDTGDAAPRSSTIDTGDAAQRSSTIDTGDAAPRSSSSHAAATVNPDGDVELPDDLVEAFTMTLCPACGGGPLKPDVVYFGESVPRPRVAHCFDLVAGARSLVVLGSSLAVMSGLRFVHAAARAKIPTAVVTTGPSRADDRADVRLDTSLGEVLPAVLRTLRLPSPGSGR